MSRPICVYCGAPYGHRLAHMEVVRWAEDGEKPEYRGNGVVLKEDYHGFNAGTTVINGDQVGGQHSAHRSIWDGETWVGGYEPFCKLRCALDYARKAYSLSLQPGLRRAQ